MDCLQSEFYCGLKKYIIRKCYCVFLSLENMFKCSNVVIILCCTLIYLHTWFTYGIWIVCGTLIYVHTLFTYRIWILCSTLYVNLRSLPRGVTHVYKTMYIFKILITIHKKLEQRNILYSNINAALISNDKIEDYTLLTAQISPPGTFLSTRKTSLSVYGCIYNLMTSVLIHLPAKAISVFHSSVNVRYLTYQTTYINQGCTEINIQDKIPMSYVNQGCM